MLERKAMVRKTLLTGTIIALIIAFITSAIPINTGLNLVLTTCIIGFDVLRILAITSLFILLITHPPRPMLIRFVLGVIAIISASTAIYLILNNSLYFFDIITMMLVSSIAMIDAIEQSPEKVHITPSTAEL